MKLKIGDIVQHKTGGPEMTVSAISLFGALATVTYWSETDQCFYEERFPVGVLRRIA